ncbi:hypothetical protein KR009_005845 [Drosophila setifemur]|nr:hypothetical protein KR009_005845 [Drosophila setifemur]
MNLSPKTSSFIDHMLSMARKSHSPIRFQENTRKSTERQQTSLNSSRFQRGAKNYPGYSQAASSSSGNQRSAPSSHQQAASGSLVTDQVTDPEISGNQPGAPDSPGYQPGAPKSPGIQPRAPKSPGYQLDDSDSPGYSKAPGYQLDDSDSPGYSKAPGYQPADSDSPGYPKAACSSLDFLKSDSNSLEFQKAAFESPDSQHAVSTSPGIQPPVCSSEVYKMADSHSLGRQQAARNSPGYQQAARNSPGYPKAACRSLDFLKSDFNSLKFQKASFKSPDSQHAVSTSPGIQPPVCSSEVYKMADSHSLGLQQAARHSPGYQQAARNAPGMQQAARNSPGMQQAATNAARLMEGAPAQPMGANNVTRNGPGVEVVHHSTRTNLIVNYLPPDMLEQELADMFSPYGKLRRTKIITDGRTGFSLCYGFVDFVHWRDAKVAQLLLDGRQVRGKRLKVSFARPRSEGIQNSNLYVTHLPADVDNHKLRALFSLYGTVLDVNILRDKMTGKSRGVAFVRFESHMAAKLAINALDQHLFDGVTQPLDVQFVNRQIRSGYMGPAQANSQRPPLGEGPPSPFQQDQHNDRLPSPPCFKRRLDPVIQNDINESKRQCAMIFRPYLG